MAPATPNRSGADSGAHGSSTPQHHDAGTPAADSPRSSVSALYHSDVNTAVNSAASKGGGKENLVVAVRVRPMLASEAAAGERCAWKTAGSDTLVCLSDDKMSYHPAQYVYNHVFGERSSSEDVYTTAVQNLVLSAVDGYNCTLFAYGQTGSGKVGEVAVTRRGPSLARGSDVGRDGW